MADYNPRGFDIRTQASLRLLRTVLEEARGVLAADWESRDAEQLGRAIAHAEREAEALVPDFLDI